MYSITHGTVRNPWKEGLIKVAADSRLAIDWVPNVDVWISKLCRTADKYGLIAEWRALRNEESKVMDVKGVRLRPIAKVGRIWDLNPAFVVRICAWRQVTGTVAPAVLARGLATSSTLCRIVARAARIGCIRIWSRCACPKVMWDWRAILELQFKVLMNQCQLDT